MIHHNSSDSLSGDPIRFVLLNDPMGCVFFPVCLMWCIHPFFHSAILSWSVGPLQGLVVHDNPLCSAIGRKWHPSLPLPIMLPWRQVGNFEVVAGVRHSVARRKLCVNMGGERCQRPGGKRVRNSVGKCEGKRLATSMKDFKWY